MKSIDENQKIIACCGLFCSNCKKYQTNKCPGCQENYKATWCKIRICCFEQNLQCCASCKKFQDPMACKKYNNPFARIIEFVTQTQRSECIKTIKQEGESVFTEKMNKIGKMSMPKPKK